MNVRRKGPVEAPGRSAPVLETTPPKAAQNRSPPGTPADPPTLPHWPLKNDPVPLVLRPNRRPAAATALLDQYAPPGRVLWDPWMLVDRDEQGPRYLFYFLSAPEGASKKQRDDGAEIWVAESRDLVTMKDLGPAVTAGPPGCKRDLAIWTGNTYRQDDGYLMFLTGRNQQDGPLQYLFLGRSDDGVHFDVGTEPLLAPPFDDPSSPYDTRRDGRVFPAWRDPAHTVRVDPQTGATQHLLLFTALAKVPEGQAPGCIGLAIADRAEGPYRLMPPLLAPGLYDQMEVPQLVPHGGRWYLFFSSAEKDYQPEWKAKLGRAVTGLHAFVADDPLGPFEPVHGTGIVPGFDTASGIYSTRLYQQEGADSPFGLGWYWSPECLSPDGSPEATCPGKRANSLAAPQPFDWARLLGPGPP